MKINIQNMSDDLHEYNEQVRTVFLNARIREFYPEDLEVHVMLDKFGKDYRLDITIRTRAHYVCDRCLAPYEQEIELNGSQIFQMGGDDNLVDEEIIELAPDAIEIDLTPVLDEMMLLNHPMKMLCKEDCKGICPHCGADLNHEVCTCDVEAIDPRWEKLRKLIR